MPRFLVMNILIYRKNARMLRFLVMNFKIIFVQHIPVWLMEARRHIEPHKAGDHLRTYNIGNCPVPVPTGACAGFFFFEGGRGQRCGTGSGTVLFAFWSEPEPV